MHHITNLLERPSFNNRTSLNQGTFLGKDFNTFRGGKKSQTDNKQIFASQARKNTTPRRKSDSSSSSHMIRKEKISKNYIFVTNAKTFQDSTNNKSVSNEKNKLTCSSLKSLDEDISEDLKTKILQSANDNKTTFDEKNKMEYSPFDLFSLSVKERREAKQYKTTTPYEPSKNSNSSIRKHIRIARDNNSKIILDKESDDQIKIKELKDSKEKNYNSKDMTSDNNSEKISCETLEKFTQPTISCPHSEENIMDNSKVKKEKTIEQLEEELKQRKKDLNFLKLKLQNTISDGLSGNCIDRSLQEKLKGDIEVLVKEIKSRGEEIKVRKEEEGILEKKQESKILNIEKNRTFETLFLRLQHTCCQEEIKEEAKKTTEKAFPPIIGRPLR